MRFWFNAIHPEMGIPLEIEASYEPAERQTLEHPGCTDAVEICHAWNKAGEPVAFCSFENELTQQAIRIARNNQ